MADFSLTRLPWRIQLIVFAVLSLATAGTFRYLVDGPVHERIADRRRELAAMRARIARSTATAQPLAALRQEVSELHARLDGPTPTPADRRDAADLLRSVNALALESNLTLRSFRPKAANTRQPHTEWPIALELEGTYHRVGTFLDRVNKLPQVITVSGLSIRGKQQPAPDATVDISFTAIRSAPFANAGASASGPIPSPHSTYVYEADGRRDPFISLETREAEAPAVHATRSRPDGLAGVLIDEVVVRGIVQSLDSRVAMVRAPTGRTFFIRPGDRLMDGVVEAITSDAVVLVREVGDPRSPQKPREVRKYLRAEVRQ